MNTRDERKIGKIDVLIENKTQLTNEEFLEKLKTKLKDFINEHGTPTQADVEKLAKEFVEENFFHKITILPAVKS